MDPKTQQPWQLRGTKYRDFDDLRNDVDYIWPEWEEEGDYKGLIEAAVDMELIDNPAITKARIENPPALVELDLTATEEAYAREISDPSNWSKS